MQEPSFPFKYYLYREVVNDISAALPLPSVFLYSILAKYSKLVRYAFRSHHIVNI